MWTYNNDYKNWVSSDDRLKKVDFDYLKQELQATRFYSRCLSGATYLPIDDLTNIYDILGNYQPKNWYISVTGSSYSNNSIIPSEFATTITSDSSYEYYTQYLGEYGLTLKNLFTPDRLIKDSAKNFYYVDVATTEAIDFTQVSPNYYIDNVRLLEGHKVLVKNQTTNITLLYSADPSTYFTGNYIIVEDLGATIEYQYFNEENGIYYYTNNKLVRATDLDDYNTCIRYSVSVKLGDANKNKQFHLSRLLNGYFPTTSLSQPIEFIEKHNWLLRNRVDYNNLFEINYYDVIKHSTQSYYFSDGITYSIPTRTISVGEFGVILNTQEGVSNIIHNKYKVNLRGISETSEYYWICGDENTLLKVRKHDFNIERILLENISTSKEQLIKTNLSSVSFFNDIKGAVVGEFNTIFITRDGGYKWERIEIGEFDGYNYNKVLYSTNTNFFIGGDTGIFIEMVDSISGWTAYKRRISRKIDNDDEYLLVDNINDLYKTNINWGLSYSYSTQSISQNKDLLFISCDNNIITAYDISNSFSDLGTDFIYFDLGYDYGNIRNITRRENTNSFYFTGTNNLTDSIFSFNIDDFNYLGTGSSYSNVTFGGTAISIYDRYPNEIFDYQGDELLICGNTSLLESYTYSGTFSILDSTFEDKLKSKLLVLDYDIASKLNFFMYNGEYRLPNSVTFSYTASDLGFNPIINGTYSETNWITYWTDTQKTFKFYSNTPLAQSDQVLISTTFSYSSTSSVINITGSDITTTEMSNLAPYLTNPTQSRYYSNYGLTGSVSTHVVYLFDYLMVIKTIPTYQVAVGDVINFESNIVNGEFVVNRIETHGAFPNTHKYLYMFTEFNENIINNLQSTTYSVTLTNLNKYSTAQNLVDRFNSHPISNAYGLTYSNSILELSAKFNNISSYYNLGTDVIYGGTYSMEYTSGFLKFGYSPTYNLLDYLININDTNSINPVFYADKEYLAMPIYKDIPLGPLTTTNCYIDSGLTYSNKILFGTGLKLEWESIFINTFVDVIIYGSSTHNINKLLVMKKYYDVDNDAYVIEFQKTLTYDGSIYKIDIISRRKLYQISEDLQELNNIQRTKSKSNSWDDNNINIYETYENELNFKIPTDSYAKVLLSDVGTIKNLSAIIYIDYKNELALNVNDLSREYIIPIQNTINYGNKVYVSCLEKHGLQTGDGAILEFTGTMSSSNQLNQQYFGYHVIQKITDYDFLTDIDYGVSTSIDDIGYLRYIKEDPFFNYQPVDLIDLGVDAKSKMSLELSIENLQLDGYTYSLINVDYEKYRFKLIDGLDITILNSTYPWILEAEISGGVIGLDGNQLVWYKGTWISGRWFGGTWISGVWMSGDWYDGIWNSYRIADKVLSIDVDTKTVDDKMSVWVNGRWYDGTWNNGTWYNGRKYNGTWNNGTWYKGVWNDGIWNDGKFIGGIWVLGTWNNGIFNTDNEPAYWIDGRWSGGDFENGMWYNGMWEEKNSLSRFGTKAYNSRTANWQSGKWVSGSFYSQMNINDSGQLDVSDIHKYSIWKTGQWLSGQWYGGIAYNMDFKTGVWYGGILEDIEVIGIDVTNDTFTLNGSFRFNDGDEIYIIDNMVGNTYSVFGSNSSIGKYTILDYTLDNNTTIINVDRDLSIIGSGVVSPINTGLRVVSRFKNLNWKSGIWTNGLYDSGLWEGGIWYNGIFSGIWS